VQRLPADLVWGALKLPTACYDWKCQAQCEGTTCHVIKDAYGNNAGYASVIARMLGELENAGARVMFAARLTKVSAAPLVSESAARLTFANRGSLTADTVVLNMPGNAITSLDKSSLIFDDKTPSNVTKLLESVFVFGMNKVYAWYADAWWSTKLGLMEGYFKSHGRGSEGAASPAPLEGRYHDGPQKCSSARTRRVCPSTQETRWRSATARARSRYTMAVLNPTTRS